MNLISFLKKLTRKSCFCLRGSFGIKKKMQILKDYISFQFQALDAVSHTLVLLGRNNILRNSLMSFLLSELQQFAEQMLQAYQVLPFFVLENIQGLVLGSVFSTPICFMECSQFIILQNVVQGLAGMELAFLTAAIQCCALHQLECH